MRNERRGGGGGQPARRTGTLSLHNSKTPPATRRPQGRTPPYEAPYLKLEGVLVISQAHPSLRATRTLARVVRGSVLEAVGIVGDW